MIPTPRLLLPLIAFGLAGTPLPTFATEKVPLPQVISAGLTKKQVDLPAFADWVGGKETPMPGEQPATWVLWTKDTQPGHSGVSFGKGTQIGKRHLRIGFTEPIPIGTVLVKGGGQLSYLKPDAAYPGDLGNDADWIPAERLTKTGVTSAAVSGQSGATWVLPPGTTTQALRFTHDPKPTDTGYAGSLNGVLILPERFVNVGIFAQAVASSNNEAARKLVNGTIDGWGSWSNLDSTAKSQGEVLSAEHPEWFMLAWKEPVSLRSLVALFSGFSAAEVQTFTGSGHPRDASEGDWKAVTDYSGLKDGYPVQLWPNWLSLVPDLKTRGIRVRITQAIDEATVHPHIKGGTKNGHRVWLGEMMALQALGDQPLASVNLVESEEASVKLNPPIPVKFTLKEPGFVSLVIEKPDGQRVRNLVSQTWFPAGENIAWWDGTNDLGRDQDAANHGLYRIPSRPVEPGEYRVRGLVHAGIEPKFEFSVYAAGQTAWNTEDKTGNWLSNHSGPQAAVYVPGDKNPTGQPLMYLGAYVSEGRDGLIWTDLDGRKVGGKDWIGGHWTAAPFIALDSGPEAIAGNCLYIGSVWETGKGGNDKAELRITALTKGPDKPILKNVFETAKPRNFEKQIGGIAARNGIVVVSLPPRNELVFVDVKAKAILGTATVETPRGLAFDSEGRLYVISGTKLLRYAQVQDPTKLPEPETLVSTGLEAPRHVTLDGQGQVFISDQGSSHQVKVFAPNGKSGEYRFVRAIGNPGAPKAGPYDPLHLNNPEGLAIDSNNRLWVTEHDYLPKRISVWTLDGKLVKAFYGPSKYGGGGTLDPQDRTRFYYADEARGAMEFRLNWEKGTSELVSVYYRPEKGDLKLPARSSAPEMALYHDGKRYFTNSFNNNPVSGGSTGFLFIERNGLAQPVAAMGRATDWDLLKQEEFASRWPEGIKPNAADPSKNPVWFTWTDANADAQVQPEEVTLQKGVFGSVTIMPDLAFLLSRVDKQTWRLAPTGFSAEGVPSYDPAAPQILAEGVRGPASSGGDQALLTQNGWTVLTLGQFPFAAQSMSGAKDGKAMWSYPSVWPGLHAGHEAPKPDQPGQLIGTTRLLGGIFEAKNTDAGPMWAVNGNLGEVYVFTADGLFVSSLFIDTRVGKYWMMPVAERGMSLKGITLNEENFWPTISQTSDGNIYIVDGGRTSLVRVDGLESIRRLPDSNLTLTPADLDKAQQYREQVEMQRRLEEGSGVLEVALLPAPPSMDGSLDDWKGKWVDIDKSGVKANFNSDSKPYDMTGSLVVAGDRLYAAFRTGNSKLLENSGEMPIALFKTGGALDIMIAANPKAKADRAQPVAGDQRLLVTLVKGKPTAMLYRAVVPGTKDPDKVPFASPWRTITLDQVQDVTDQIEFGSKSGNFEFSIPLSVLGIQPQPGLKLKGDIGILRGTSGTTTARTYWSNKATSIVSDVPSEAMLTPSLWGTLEFKEAK